MYSDEKREAALKYYPQCGSVTETVIQLGCPSKMEKKYLRKGTVALMHERDIRPGKLEEGHENSDTK